MSWILCLYHLHTRCAKQVQAARVYDMCEVSLAVTHRIAVRSTGVVAHGQCRRVTGQVGDISADTVCSLDGLRPVSSPLI